MRGREGERALDSWQLHGDARPWAKWLAELRTELDDPNGWSREYHGRALAALACSDLTTQDITELARESRPILAELLDHDPWPVPALWWGDQIRAGKREGARHVAAFMAMGADNERPNGARLAAAALAILRHLHDVNSVYYADHDVPMDAAAVTGTHEMRDLLRKVEALAGTDADMATVLLRSVGDPVDIPESVLAENHRLRDELADLQARIDGVQLQLMEFASQGDEAGEIS